MSELGSSFDKDDIDMYELFSDSAKEEEPPSSFESSTEPLPSFNSTEEVYKELFVI